MGSGDFLHGGDQEGNMLFKREPAEAPLLLAHPAGRAGLKMPFYDMQTGYGTGLHEDLETLRASVSHIVTGDPNLAVPGYAVEKTFGNLRILRREEDDAPVRRWRDFTPLIMSTHDQEFLRRTFPETPPPPSNFNIRFGEPE